FHFRLFPAFKWESLTLEVKKLLESPTYLSQIQEAVSSSWEQVANKAQDWFEAVRNHQVEEKSGKVTHYNGGILVLKTLHTNDRACFK
uniref:Uncharacterized protein n=1 Tax=Xenopus tropicalis TaxID=8364 RepID=A0A6I8SLP4_XENTR